MPTCKDCTHYWSKAFPEMPWNYECKLGRDTPQYGDTESCPDYEEQYTIGLERGWSYREEKQREDSSSNNSERSAKDNSDSCSCINNDNSYSSYDYSYSSSSGSEKLYERVALAILMAPAIYIFFTGGGNDIKEVESIVIKFWSPTGDQVLNFFIDTVLIFFGLYTVCGLFFIYICLAIISVPISLLVTIGSLSPVGFLISIIIAVFLILVITKMILEKINKS